MKTLKFLLFALIGVLVAGCSSLTLPMGQSYDRENLCNEISRELAFVQTNKNYCKRLTQQKYDELVRQYILNGCNK